jgi:putative protease
MCAQPCRLPFSACKNPEGCVLSLKDLSLVNKTAELKKLGVTSLKIEGRMKRPEYVAAAVTALRSAADGTPPDMDSLRAVFSRSGFTDGYFTGKRQDMFGVREKEDVVSAKKVLPGLRQLYKNEGKADSVTFKATVKSHKPFELTAKDGSGNSVTIQGAMAQEAVNKALDHEFLTRQLSKLGDTVFTLEKVDGDIDEGLTLSAKEINEARRTAVSKLSEKRILSNTPSYKIYPFKKETKNREKSPARIRARISSINQLEAVLSADKIIIPSEEFLKCSVSDCDKFIIEPPRFIENEKDVINTLMRCREKGASHLMCSNPAYITSGAELGFKLHGDFGLNITNSYSLKRLEAMGVSDALLSFELKLSQISRLESEIDTGIIAYGYLPAMLMRNCPIKNEIGCKKCKKKISDRTGRSFTAVCHGNYTELLNSQCLYMADRLSEIKNVSFITLYFTSESKAQAEDIIKWYSNGKKPDSDITRGLYYRGVLMPKDGST